MTFFDDYAKYYDLLYHDKDYASEAMYVDRLIQRYLPGAKTVLELGCGTGKHSAMLAKKGFTVHGVDKSARMLECANARWRVLADDVRGRLICSESDIRELKITQHFDVVLALFHVISYMPTNDDLEAVFTVVKDHLNEGGLFIFDCWYGPGVLRDPPEVRTKQWEDESVVVKRVAEPKMYPNENLVEVNYRITVSENVSTGCNEFKEVHTMRYLFKPEIEILLKKQNMNIRDLFTWMTMEEADFSSWNAVFIAQS